MVCLAVFMCVFFFVFPGCVVNRVGGTLPNLRQKKNFTSSFGEHRCGPLGSSRQLQNKPSAQDALEILTNVEI